MTAPGCPFCGEPEASIDEVKPRRFALVCEDCGAIGPEADTQEEAVTRWNARVNRMDWPVTWLPMPEDERAAGIEAACGPHRIKSTT